MARLVALVRDRVFRHTHRGPAWARDLDRAFQQQQRLLANQWAEWRMAGRHPYAAIHEAGFRCYSECEEDGILLFLMTMLGVSRGTIVEIGCGDGTECMATNLVINHGFTGVLFDGRRENVRAAQAFFAAKRDCHLIAPTVVHEWITVANVDQVLRQAGVPHEVDLLAMDIDGNEYWIWEAMGEVRPKVCCLETNDVIPSDRSLTIPYRPDFDCWRSPQPDFRSASLAAMVALGRRKGYRLIGAHRHGFNVVFMREDIGRDLFPEIPVAAVHDNPWTRRSQASRWPAVRDCPWVEVS